MSNTAMKFDFEDTKEAQFSTNEDFENLFNESLNHEKIEGTVINGVVTNIENDFVVVDIGLKSEGIIPLKEFHITDQGQLPAPGDQVEVFLERIENFEGKTIP